MWKDSDVYRTRGILKYATFIISGQHFILITKRALFLFHGLVKSARASPLEFWNSPSLLTDRICTTQRGNSSHWEVHWAGDCRCGSTLSGGVSWLAAWSSYIWGAAAIRFVVWDQPFTSGNRRKIVPEDHNLWIIFSGKIIYRK